MKIFKVFQLVLFPFIFAFLSCSNPSDDKASNGSSADNIVDIVRDYLSEHELKYELYESEDSIMNFQIEFNLEDEIPSTIIINIPQKDDTYTIIGKYGRTLPSNTSIKGCILMNQFNLTNPTVTGLMTQSGSLCFKISRNIDDHAYSRRAFNIDFYSVYEAMTEDSKIIYEKAIETWVNLDN